MAYDSASFREHNETRLPTLQKLVELGWSRAQIVCPSPDTSEKEWRVPKNPSAQAARERGRTFQSYPVDIAVFDSVEGSSDPEHALIIIECKLPGDPSGLSELETYLTLEPRTKMGILTNGNTITRTYKLADGTYRHIYNSTLPTPDEDFIVSQKSLTWYDLHTPTEDELCSAFKRLLDVVVSGDGTSTRSDDRLDQICNLLLLKLESDSVAVRNKQKKVLFQVQEDRSATVARINHAFERYCKRNPSLFDANAVKAIRLDESTIHAAVYELQNMNLSEMKPTALSYAFQVFRSANLKIGEGQYYTPYRVIEAGTKMMQIRVDDRVIDPACGTGGFLSQAFLTVRDEVGEWEASKWASRNLFGVDLDDINVKLVRAFMVGIGDGSTNAYLGDSLRERKWVNDTHGIKDALSNESYTVVLTNPPFGKNLKMLASDAREAQYSICDRSILGNPQKTYADTELGIVFVERAWRLLEKGGRLGIVLPETYFFSKSYEWFRAWLDDHFDLLGVLNIPMEAFQGFCRAKTNFYVLQKKDQGAAAPAVAWGCFGSAWVSNAPTIGINKDGNELYKIDGKTHVPSSQIDDVALDDVENLLRGGTDTDTSCYVPNYGVSKSFVGVPKYSDQRTAREHDRWVRESLKGCVSVSLGELLDMGFLTVRGGHGSPSAHIRGGSIPYIKVSDLRNGLVNPNPSNMVSLDVARKFWRGESSGLDAYSILTPARASKNIGEPVMLLPGQENVVLTKEVLVFGVTKAATFNTFYLMWALCSKRVIAQWSRVIYMQTNREDVGNRWKEIRIPLPSSKEVADELAKPYRDYYTGLVGLRASLCTALADQGLE